MELSTNLIYKRYQGLKKVSGVAFIIELLYDM